MVIIPYVFKVIGEGQNCVYSELEEYTCMYGSFDRIEKVEIDAV